jgi:hypothetical protein
MERNMDNIEPELTPGAFLVRVSALLRDQPRGTAALIDDFCVAWFDGTRAVLAYLREDDAAQLDEEFDLDDCEWLDWHERAQTWLRHPVCTDLYQAQLLARMTVAGAARRTLA